MAFRVDSKSPILPCGTDDLSDERSKGVRRGLLKHPVVVWIGRILQVLVIVCLVYRYRPQSNCTREARPIPDANGNNLVYQSPSLNYTKREIVHFDINVPAYGPVSPGVSITESLGICQYSYAWNATGRIRLALGDPQQPYNFMIGIDISGSSQQAIDSVVWPIHSEFNAMYIRCVEFSSLDETRTDWDATIHVDVTVFVKPHTLQFGDFRINTGNLDIEIEEGLTFETYHMHLYSAGGSIRGRETEGFTAHEISAIAMNGSITGNWSLPQQIELRTGGWNSLNKPIDIDLVPKRWSSGPSTPGILVATTNGGDIDIRMPLKDDISLRNMSISVHSRLGSIHGTFVTGYATWLSTLSGSIDATLQPYYALQDPCVLSTSTAAGHTKIHVLPPIIDNYYQVNPLKNTKSEHSTTSGALELRYPPQWVGAALGLSETGSVVAKGERFNTIIQEDHLVVARTENEIASRLDFFTTTGDGSLVVE